MGGRSQVLPLLERKATDKQEEEARMIHMATHVSQRHQYYLSFSLISGHIQKYIYRYGYIQGLVHTQISFLCQLRGPRSNDVQAATSISNPQILVANTVLSNNRNWSFLEKCLSLELGQEI